MTRVFLILVLVALCAGALPQKAQAIPACWRFHIVRPGQTLRSIADMYDVPMRALARINGIDPPFRVYPGEPICIPYVNYERVRQTGSIHATVLGSRILIWGEGLKAYQTFYVRVGVCNSAPWFRLGKATVPKSKELRLSYQLPPRLHNKENITVCLKNVVSDIALCTQAIRRY